MREVDKRTESDGKGLFIIRNGQKIAKYEAGKWVPLLPGVVVRSTPDAASDTRRTRFQFAP
jgi:hypothetical protein